MPIVFESISTWKPTERWIQKADRDVGGTCWPRPSRLPSFPSATHPSYTSCHLIPVRTSVIVTVVSGMMNLRFKGK